MLYMIPPSIIGSILREVVNFAQGHKTQHPELGLKPHNMVPVPMLVSNTVLKRLFLGRRTTPEGNFIALCLLRGWVYMEAFIEVFIHVIQKLCFIVDVTCTKANNWMAHEMVAFFVEYILYVSLIIARCPLYLLHTILL